MDFKTNLMLFILLILLIVIMYIVLTNLYSPDKCDYRKTH